MKTVSKASALGLAGLVVGWSAAALQQMGAGNGSASGEAALLTKSDLAGSGLAPRRKAASSLPTDVAACREAVFAEPDDQHPLLRRFAREQALRRWLELDARGALAEAAKDPKSPFASDLFKTWATMDPRGALEALNRAPGSLASAVAREFFLSLMTRDPALAAAELAKPMWLDKTGDRLGWGFSCEVRRQWMKADPAAAIASLGPAGSKTSLNSDERAMAVVWAETDFSAAWAHLVGSGVNRSKLSDSDVMPMLACGLMKGDPKALEILGGLPNPTDPSSLDRSRYYLAEAMGELDSQAALRWASSLPEGDVLRMQIESRAARLLASSDPEAALALWEASKASYPHGDGEDEGPLRESFAALAALDPAGAEERVRELSERHRVFAMGGMLTRLFADDPVGAEAQCRAWMNDPELQPALAKAWALSFSWTAGSGARDPGEMLEAIPELNAAVDANVLSTWTKANPEAAAGWIRERLEQGNEVKFSGDFGDQGILADLAISKPEFTAAWLVDLPDPKLGAQAAQTLAANWCGFDPVAADSWIESLPPGPLRDAAEKGRGRQGERITSDPFAE